MKKVLNILLCVLLLVGCANSNDSNQNNQNEENDDPKLVLDVDLKGDLYQVLIPFTQSKLRNYHSTMTRQDRIELSARLQEMSSNHFSQEKYYVSEGTVVDNALHNRLIKYETIYDEGLNPRADQEFETTSVNRTVVGPVIVTDIIELDFYESQAVDAPIEGIALAITLNKFTTLEDGTVVELSEETMVDWGESSARKLVSIIRSLSGMTNVPIFVALYSLEKQDSTLPGGYVSSAFFEGRSGQFTRNKEEWLLFPSEAANNRVNQLAVEFDLYRQSLSSLIAAETTGVIASGRLINGTVDYLKIEINTAGRTFLELQALTQYAANLLDRFNNFDIDITVQIKVVNEVVSIISLENDSQEATIVYF